MVFIAAEIGVNFTELAQAEYMIGCAKNCGVNAVKFQVFREEHIKGHPREKELQDIILTKEDLVRLKKTADNFGVEMFATPMFPEAVDWLEEIGVKRYKIRCADRENLDLIRKVVKCGKPVYISLDSTTISAELRCLLQENENNLKGIYCVPKYPPEMKDIHLNAIIFGKPHSWYGYSNHYPSIVPSLVAVVRGARYIEIHVKLKRYAHSRKPIDDAISIDFWDLNNFVKLSREMVSLL